MTVFIMILENDRYEVLPTWDYQQSAYEIYIKNKYTSKIEFFAPHDETIKFTLERFDSAKNGLKGDYNDFLLMTTEYNQKHYLSNNEQKIKGFCDFINRVSMEL